MAAKSAEETGQNKVHWGYDETKCLAETWDDEEIRRQLSTKGRKQKIWENIAAKL